MHNRFIHYLNQLNINEPDRLNSCHAKIQNRFFSENITYDFFSKFPFFTENTETISDLANDFHIGLMNINFERNTFKDEAKLKTHFSNVITKLYISGCASLLDENGDIHPQIAAIINLVPNIPPQEFIISYLEHILIPTIFENWVHKRSLTTIFTDQNINNLTMLNIIKEEIKNYLTNNNDLHASLIKLTNEVLAKRPAENKSLSRNLLDLGSTFIGYTPTEDAQKTKLANLLIKQMQAALIFDQSPINGDLTQTIMHSFQEKFQPICSQDQELQTIINSLRLNQQTFISEIETLIKELAEDLTKNKLTALYTQAKTFLSQYLANLLRDNQPLLINKIHDYTIYGRPFIEDFNHFHMSIHELTECFNDLLTTQKIQHFALKIYCGAYASVVASPNSQVSINEFIKNILVQIITTWFDTTRYKQDLLASNLDKNIVETTLDNLVNILNSEPTEALLKTLHGKPADYKSIACQLNHKEIWIAAKQIEGKQILSDTKVIITSLNESIASIKIKMEEFSNEIYRVTQDLLEKFSPYGKIFFKKTNATATQLNVLLISRNNYYAQASSICFLLEKEHTRLSNGDAYQTPTLSLQEINEKSASIPNILNNCKTDCAQINAILQPLLQLREEALPTLQSIFDKLKFIFLDNPYFWFRRVKLGGGVEVNFNGEIIKVPERAAKTIFTLRELDKTSSSVDLKLAVVLNNFITLSDEKSFYHNPAKATAAFFGRSVKTENCWECITFFAMNLLQNKFYDKNALIQTTKKLEEFMDAYEEAYNFNANFIAKKTRSAVRPTNKPF